MLRRVWSPTQNEHILVEPLNFTISKLESPLLVALVDLRSVFQNRPDIMSNLGQNSLKPNITCRKPVEIFPKLVQIVCAAIFLLAMLCLGLLTTENGTLVERWNYAPSNILSSARKWCSKSKFKSMFTFWLFFNEKHGIQSTTREVGLQANSVTFYLLTYTEPKFGTSGRRLVSLKGAIIILTLEETFFLGYRAQNWGKKESEVNYALFSANGAHVVHLGVNTCQGWGDGALATEISISELVRIRLEVLID